MLNFIKYKIRFFASQSIIKWYLVVSIIVNAVYAVIKHMNTPNYFIGRSFNYSLLSTESDYNISPLVKLDENLTYVVVISLVLFMSYIIVDLMNKEMKLAKYTSYKFLYKKNIYLSLISYFILIFILVFTFYSLNLFFLHIFTHSSGTIFLGPNYSYSYAIRHFGILIESNPLLFDILTILLFSLFITMCSMISYGISLVTKYAYFLPFMILILSDKFVFEDVGYFSYKIALFDNFTILSLWLYGMLVAITITTIGGLIYSKERI